MSSPATPSSRESLAALNDRLLQLEAESEIRRLVSEYHWVNDAGSSTGRMPSWTDLQDPAADGTAAEILGDKQVAGGMKWSGQGLSNAWPHLGGVAYDDRTPRPDYMPRMFHMLTNEWLEVDGMSARGHWYCWEPAVVITDGAPIAVIIAGRIRCQFTREVDGWRFAASDYEEVLSTPFPGGGWLETGAVPYGPRNTRPEKAP